MAVEFVQEDFGGFDPRFIGVSLKFDSQRIADLIVAEWTGKSQTVDCSESKPVEQFEQLAALTVLAHELRHFHDFLIAPIGAITFQRRVSILINFKEFIRLAVSGVWEGANCLPVPIPSWCRKSELERSQLLAQWNERAQSQGIGPLVVPPFPFTGEEAGALSGVSRLVARNLESQRRLISVLVSHYDALRALTTESFGWPREAAMTVLPAHVMEASAVLVQLQEVGQGYGRDCAQVVYEGLTRADVYRFILALLNVISVEHKQPISVALGSIAIQWCLLANPRLGLETHTPVARLAFLTRHLYERGLPGPDDADPDLEVCFTEWDQASNSPSTLTQLRNTLDLDESYLTHLQLQHERILKLEPSERDLREETFAEVVEICKQFNSARRHCVERLLADPSRYAIPHRYLSDIWAMVSPEVKLILSPGVQIPTWFEKRTWYRGPGGDIVGPKLEVAGEHRFESDLVWNLSTDWSTSDVLFAEHGRHRDVYDFRMVRDELHEFHLVSIID